MEFGIVALLNTLNTPLFSQHKAAAIVMIMDQNLFQYKNAMTESCIGLVNLGTETYKTFVLASGVLVISGSVNSYAV